MTARSEVALDVILTRGAATWRDKPCIIVPEGKTVTYGELDQAASAFAEFLLERGSAPGDRLILANCNTPEFFIGLFGGIRAGMVVLPMDAALSREEIRKIFAHGTPHAVVVDARSAPAFAGLDVPLLALGNVPGATTCDRRVPLGDRPLSRGPATDAAVISYTSGTTGTPKGVMHSHAGILRKVEDIKACFGFDDSYRALCMLPTHFGHGLIAVCLSTFNYGGTLILTSPFSVEMLPRVFPLIQQYQVNTFSSVPTIVRLLLRNAEVNSPPAVPSLRFVTCASAPLHLEELEAFERRFAVPLLVCYGLTEACTWSAMSSREPRSDKRAVGVAFGCRMRAVGGDGQPLPPTEIGDLQVSGPSVMLGYYQDPAATAEVLSDGWLKTGDLGRVDENGAVFLAGRRKELIIRAGANIYPAEVEAAILSHPGVAEAYVLGVEHGLLGEAVGACVVRKSGATVTSQELLKHCQGLLAQYKWPQEIVFVDQVPKTSRGKVNKLNLKSLFAAR